MKKIVNQSALIFLLFAVFLRTQLDRFNALNVLSLNDGRLNLSLTDTFSLISFVGASIFLLLIYKDGILGPRSGLAGLPGRLASLRSLLGIAVLLYLFWSAASIFWSIDKISSLQELVRLLAISSIGFLAYGLVRSGEKFRAVVFAVLAAAVIPSLVAVKETLEGVERVSGTFAHPNPFSFFLLLVLALGLGAAKPLVSRISTRYAMGLVFLLSVPAALIVLTLTRSAWFGLLVLTVGLAVSWYPRLLVFLAIATSGLVLFSQGVAERLVDLLVWNPFSSLAWRLALWHDIWPVAKQNILLGWGLGTFEKLAEFTRGLRLGSLEAHNDYLGGLVELGVPGLVLYLAIFILLLTILIKTKYHFPDPSIRHWAGLTAGVVFIFLLISAFDNVLRVTAFQFSLWAVIGGLLGVICAGKKETRPGP